MKSWRKQLEEIGGYENEMISVPAGAVRKMIEEMEQLEQENRQLAALAGKYAPLGKVTDEDIEWAKGVLRKEVKA